MLLLIDNYDSFVHNLARYFQRLGQETRVIRNDVATVSRVEELSPRAIVFSPGPCTPDEAGHSLELVRRFHGAVPLLGVCLGHQTIAAALGASIVLADEPMHGRVSTIAHDAEGLFEGVPSPLKVCRYHSLTVAPASLPDQLRVTARTPDGVIMALASRGGATFGVQFHPESVLTEFGFVLLANFLRQSGCEPAGWPDSLPDEHVPIAPPPHPRNPDTPLTF